MAQGKNRRLGGRFKTSSADKWVQANIARRKGEICKNRLGSGRDAVGAWPRVNVALWMGDIYISPFQRAIRPPGLQKLANLPRGGGGEDLLRGEERKIRKKKRGGGEERRRGGEERGEEIGAKRCRI